MSETLSAPNVIDLSELQVSETAALFEGREHGANASFFSTEHPPGKGPGLHRHPYEEIFIVRSGAGRFTAGEQEIELGAGQVLIVPPNTWHGFTAIGDEPLVQVSIHPAARMEQEWLEEDELPR